MMKNTTVNNGDDSGDDVMMKMMMMVTIIMLGESDVSAFLGGRYGAVVRALTSRH